MPRQTTSEMTRVVRFANSAPLAEVEQALELIKDAVKTRRAASADRSEKIRAGRKAAKPRKRRGKKIEMPSGEAAQAAPVAKVRKLRRKKGTSEVTGGELPSQD